MLQLTKYSTALYEGNIKSKSSINYHFSLRIKTYNAKDC